MKVVVGVLAVLSMAVGQTCFEGPGGASMTETKAGGHNIQVGADLPIFLLQLDFQVTKAIIGKPAPAFSGTAVLNGEFKELKLSDYLGTFLTPFFLNFPSHLTLYCFTIQNDIRKDLRFPNRKIFGVFLLPT